MSCMDSSPSVVQVWNDYVTFGSPLPCTQLRLRFAPANYPHGNGRVGKMVVRVVGRVLAGVMQRVNKLLGSREGEKELVGGAGRARYRDGTTQFKSSRTFVQWR